jgi:N-terminal acetyltransferase B complex non-catalytic subunit
MRTILYKLAHRLLSANTQISYATPERFHLHLSVLKELQLWEEADKLMAESIGPVLVKSSLVCDELRREIAQQRNQWKEEGERAREKIVEKKFVVHPIL